MDFHTTTPTKPRATPLQANGSSLTTSSPIESGTNLSLLHLLSDSSQSLSGANFDCLFSGSARIGEVKRVTKETNVFVKINLDGTGIADSSTGIPFLDHMLDVSNLFFLFGFY
jgi:imidazoleglycerol-phosphate dehydratase